MRIAHVCPFYKPTICGVGQVVYELSQRQVKEGYEVHVFTSDWDKYERIKVKEEVIEGVHVHRCWHYFKAVNFVSFWPSVFFKLLRYNFDVIHSHIPGHSHAILAAFASKIKKIRHIHTTHCPWTEGYRSKFGIFMDFISKKTYIPILFNLTYKIIAITPWEINFLLKYGTKKERIVIIPNGMSDILYKKMKNNDFRERLRISEKDKLVLFFGRLNPTKGIDKLMEVAKEILKERKDIYFVFRGPDEGMKYLVDDASKENKNILYVKETRDKEEIAKTYQSADVYALPSYREGLPLCCHPDTLIETEEGLKEINKVKINEKVLTHKGRFCKVIKTVSRKINEEIISVKPYGINQDIKLTKEHPVLAIKRPKKKYGKSIGEIITKSKPAWIKAGDLNEGDCVVFPIPKHESNLNYLDLVKFDNSLEYSSDKVWYKMGFSGRDRNCSYSDLMKRTGETKRIIEEAVKCLNKKKSPPKSKRIEKVLKFLRNINFNIKEVNTYSRFIKIDEKIAYVFGWYIAEGSTGHGFIKFSLNKDEISHAKEIDEVICSKFGVKGTISVENNRLSLVFCGRILENVFSELCGKGCRNKRIPKEMFNKRLLPFVIEGLFLGDGHFNKFGWILSTTSRQLVNDVVLSLLKMNKKFNFHKPRRDIYIINYKPDNADISHSNKSWFVGDNLCFMIRSIKKVDYSGDIYNLEVEKDNSYTTSGFCVHNCMFEAFASGLPVVASPVNGVPYEMKEPENGFLVEYGDIKNLKKRILQILDDKKLARKISKNNKLKSRNYDWNLIYKKTMELYTN